MCSFQHKRQQTKKISQDQRPTYSHFQSNGDEDNESENAVADSVTRFGQETAPDDEDDNVNSHTAIEHINDNALNHPTVTEETKPLVIPITIYC